MLRLVALLLTLPPEPAAWIAAAAHGRIDLAPRAVEICQRESECTAIGIHRRDRGRSPEVWRMAVRAGRVDPWCQDQDDGWSTRGAFGAMAGFYLYRLGVPCLPPWVIEFPIIGGLLAIDMLEGAEQARPRSPLRRWAGRLRARRIVFAYPGQA